MPRTHPRKLRRGARPSPLLFVVPLAAAMLAFAAPGAGLPLPRPALRDVEAARFVRCHGGRTRDCVIDGDTFRYRGEKIRIADINAPETSEPHCAGELARGEAATARLQALLNAGPFSLERRPEDEGRNRDRYGRLLREVTRGGESLGETLVDEGLAERWKGYRGNWC